MKTVTVISAQLAGILQRMTLAAAEDEEYQDKLGHVRCWGEAHGLREEKGLLITEGGCIVVPRDDVLRTLLLAEAHDSRLGGHFGESRTLEKLRRVWFWKGMSRDVSEYVRSCSKCQAVKSDTGETEGFSSCLLQHLSYGTLLPWILLAVSSPRKSLVELTV